MCKPLRLFSFLLATLLAWPALATPASPVQRYFQELRTLRADFIQRVYDERGRIAQTSSGRMLMQKPACFAGIIAAPAAQVIRCRWGPAVDL